MDVKAAKSRVGSSMKGDDIDAQNKSSRTTCFKALGNILSNWNTSSESVMYLTSTYLKAQIVYPVLLMKHEPGLVKKEVGMY